jgi:hypothetical protein
LVSHIIITQTVGQKGKQEYQALSKQEHVGHSSSFALSPQQSALL